MIILKEDESQEIKINDFIIIIKHNDVGFSLDVIKNDTYLLEEQFWFSDLEDNYKYEAGL